MEEAPRLLGQRGREARVGVTERGDCDAGAEVEVAAPLGVPDLAAAAALEDDRGLAVVAEEARLADRDEIGRARVHAGEEGLPVVLLVERAPEGLFGAVAGGGAHAASSTPAVPRLQTAQSTARYRVPEVDRSEGPGSWIALGSELVIVPREQP